MSNVLFFERHGNEIEFKNKADFLKKFSNINCSVPRRNEGRKSEHRERYDLKIYLSVLTEYKLLKFPFKVEKSESPDFIISFYQEEKIGLEMVDAGTEEEQQLMTKQDKIKKDTLFVSGPNNKHFLIESNENEEFGEGWDGDSVEREWVSNILDTINKKVSKLNEPYFKKFNKNELLIYDTIHAGHMLNVNGAIPLLKKAIVENSYQRGFKDTFHCISILRINQLLYDIENECPVLTKRRVRGV